jgi:hypothetical protein
MNVRMVAEGGYRYSIACNQPVRPDNMALGRNQMGTRGRHFSDLAFQGITNPNRKQEQQYYHQYLP